MSKVCCDVLVVGAGVVGLAVARRFAQAGCSTILIEKNARYGSETSSRNSEVIHAGLYYPEGSLKSELCLIGRELLYEYCEKMAVVARPIGKYVVAPTTEEMGDLNDLYLRARANGADEVRLLSDKRLSSLKGILNCAGILDSPRTGILDSHSLMTALLHDFEQSGGTVAWQTSALKYSHSVSGVLVDIDDENVVEARIVINSSGHAATQLLPARLASSYTCWFAKGSYFSYSSDVPFDRLVYPVPRDNGLGIHLTFDLDGRARFGPDFEKVSCINYDVNPNKIDFFYDEISRYWPSCSKQKLQPAYAGVRSKIQHNNAEVTDFLMVPDKSVYGGEVLHLLGIDSPGLTCCMAIADKIYESFT